MHFLQFTLVQQFSGVNAINTPFQIKKHMLFPLLKKRKGTWLIFFPLQKQKLLKWEKFPVLVKTAIWIWFSWVSFLYLLILLLLLVGEKRINTKRGFQKGHTMFIQFINSGIFALPPCWHLNWLLTLNGRIWNKARGNISNYLCVSCLSPPLVLWWWWRGIKKL